MAASAGAELRRHLGLVRGGELDKEPLVDLGVEDSDADAIGGERVSVGVRESEDKLAGSESFARLCSRWEGQMDLQSLAVHRTIVAVDVEGFGDRRRTNPNQMAIREGLYGAMREAFGQAGIAWNDRDHEDRGDGMLILVGPEVPKSLFAVSLPPALASALRRHNDTHSDMEQIRLRLALHAGEVNYDQYGATGASINLTFRLLECDPLKEALVGSSGVLAIIASSWFFEEVIRHNVTDALAYYPVPVMVKETAATGWICLLDQSDRVVGSHLPAAGASWPTVPKFGDRLRGLRLDAGLTQEELAEATGLSVSARAISDLERGMVHAPRKHTVRQLANALGLEGAARDTFEAAARGRARAGRAPVADRMGQREADDEGAAPWHRPHDALGIGPSELIRPQASGGRQGEEQFYTWTEEDFQAGTQTAAEDSEIEPLEPWEPVDVVLLRRGRLPNLQREFAELGEFFGHWITPGESRKRRSSELVRMLWLEGDQGPERSKGLLVCLALVGRTGRAVYDTNTDLAVAAQAFGRSILADGSALPPVIGVDLDATQGAEPWNIVKNIISNANKQSINNYGQSPAADRYPRIVVAGTEAQKQAAYAILAGRVDIEPVDVRGRPGQRPESDQLGQFKSSDHDRIYNRGLPVTACDLYGRRHELGELREAWESRHIKVMSVVGYGGTGKSSLVNAWLHEMQQKNYPGASRVLAWSFYSQGTKENLVSADPFVNAALDWLGDDSARSLSSWAKGLRLAQLIKQFSFLLVLDGLEPLQHPLEAPHVGGQLTDDSVRALLTELAKPDWDGLCLITTRVPLTDLTDVESQTSTDATRRAVVQLNLENLNEWDGAELLLHLIGEDASHAECRQAVREVDGHALAITLLGHYLKDVHGGDLAGRFGLARLTVDAREGGHARRIMASYAWWLEQHGKHAQLAILLLMGLFDRPAPPEATEALLLDPRMAPFTEMLGHPGGKIWDDAAGALREIGLLNREVAELPGTLDAHPLVREHFREQIQKDHQELWIQGNRTLFDYYTGEAPFQPSDSAGMTLLYAAVTHGFAAGLHQEVFDDVLLRRIWRDRRTNYSTRHLGMTGSDLVALSNYFFPRQWMELRTPSLSARGRALILTNAGVRLRQLGRLVDAQRSFGAVVREIDSRPTAASQELEDASYAAAQNCELLVIAGKLTNHGDGTDGTDTALYNGRRAVEYADRGNDPYFRIHARSALAEVYFMINDLTAAQSLFDESQLIERNHQPTPKPPFLYSQGLFRYGYFMIETGQAEALLKRADVDRDFGRNGGDSSLLSEAIRLLVLGAARRALIEVGRKSRDLLSEAESLLKDAMASFHTAGYADYTVRGLLEYAHFYRIEHSEQNYASVLATLDKAEVEAKRGRMELLYTDVLLQRAACHLTFWPTIAKSERSDVKKLIAQVLAESARRLSAMGYARRAVMLRQLQEAAEEVGIMKI
jgi:transcriptional regulator with XRE-family HTH domain